MRLQLLFIVIIVLLGPAIAAAAGPGSTSTAAATHTVQITQPEKDGTASPEELTVKGTASLGVTEHLWVLSHRIEGFEDLWWPQNEGKPEPRTGEWSVTVHLGVPQDAGYEFELAAIVVAEAEHGRLTEYRKKAMVSGQWLPMEMPKTSIPPTFRKVKKEK